LFITLHDHDVLEENRRSAGAHADGTEFSEVNFPREFAVEVVSVKTFGAEVCIDHLAVSRGCRSGIGTLAMTIVVRCSLPRCRLPQDLAVIAIDGDDFESVLLVSADAVGMHK